MSEELVPQPQDNAMIRDSELALAQDAANTFRWQRDEIAKDLEKALNICRQYQRILSMLNANDPNWVAVNQLLTRYKMAHEHTTNAPGKIFAGGQDITLHPDSIEGSTSEVEELPASDKQELEECAGYYDSEGDDGDPC